MKTRSIVLGLAVLVGSSLPANAQQPKDVVIEGQVKAGVHKFKLDKSLIYQFEVKGKNFGPNVTLAGGGFLRDTADFAKERNTFRSIFSPPMTQEYTLIIVPNVFGTVPEGPLDYTVTLKTMKLDENPVLKKEDKLTAADPKYGNPNAFQKTCHKAYAVSVKKGQTYVIDMIAKKAEGNAIDPYLLLEDAKLNIVARDDDGGGFPNARIMFTPFEDGEYKVIATGLNDRTAVGDYTILVRKVMEGK